MDMDQSSIRTVLVLGIMGAAVGVGQLLVDDDRGLSVRAIIGRALTSGALGVAAGAILIWQSDLPFEALAGLAAALASIGTSTLERVLRGIIKKRYGNGGSN